MCVQCAFCVIIFYSVKEIKFWVDGWFSFLLLGRGMINKYRKETTTTTNKQQDTMKIGHVPLTKRSCILNAGNSGSAVATATPADVVVVPAVMFPFFITYLSNTMVAHILWIHELTIEYSSHIQIDQFSATLSCKQQYKINNNNK